MSSVLVFGSINLDLSIEVPQWPQAGHTVLGTRLTLGPGGKGGNQAHAARLYGADVSLVGAVGRDAFGEHALRGLEQAGVDTRAVRRLQGVTTGIACISVNPAGENQIVVAAGANERLDADWVAAEQVAGCRVLLLQNEVPLALALPLMRRFKAAGRQVMLNLAPAGPIPEFVPSLIDWLIVNEHELSQAMQQPRLEPGRRPEVGAARLAAAWNCTVVVTLGAVGAVACKPSGECLRLPAPAVEVVDTTGAGDTFCGTLAAAWALGEAEHDALAAATTAASLSCRRRGAQPAQPSRSEVQQALLMQTREPAAPWSL